MSTPHELIQQAIDRIERPRRRRKLQAAFDRNPSAFIDLIVDQCDDDDDQECEAVADYLDGTSSSVDPDKLKKWLDLLVKLLPLLLLFL